MDPILQEEQAEMDIIIKRDGGQEERNLEFQELVPKLLTRKIF